MEDWLQAFDPLVQDALVSASRLVARRGGDAVSVEDVLLVLLEPRYPLSGFLQQHGVDLDELVRAIQCEQPLVCVAEVDGGFSRELTQWLARARANNGAVPGLSELMWTLVSSCDRLSQRAYVTVLEGIAERHWRGLGSHTSRGATAEWPGRFCDRLDVLEDSPWPASQAGFAQARHLTALAAYGFPPLLQLPARSLVQARGLVSCAVSVYADCFGHPVAPWRVQVASLFRSGKGVSATLRKRIEQSPHPVNWFFLDNVTPDLLAAIVDYEGVLAWAELASEPSVVLIMAHPPSGGSSSQSDWLSAQLGRTCATVSMPAATGADVLRYCRNIQPMLETAIGMSVETAALQLAVMASGRHGLDSVTHSGDWLERGADYDRAQAILRASAARVRLEMSLGPARLAALEAREKMDEQAELLGFARGDVTGVRLFQEDESLEKAAAEVDWLEDTRERVPVLDQAAVLRWLDDPDSVSSSASGFWYDAPCLSVVTKE